MRGKKILATLGLLLFAGIVTTQMQDMSTVQAAEMKEEKAASTLAETPESDFTWDGTTIVSYDGDDTVVVIPSKATAIGDGAFYECLFIEDVVIPDSVIAIEALAFYKCTSLKEVVIPNNVTTIDDGAFMECTSLMEVTIPNSVTTIGMAAFYNCTSLKEVVIPNSVTTIGVGAFHMCTSLKEVVIPNSITRIEVGVFGRCYSLKEISIPNTVTSIGGFAFGECSSLKEVTLPQSVTTIDEGAFSHCPLLEKVYVENKNVEYKINTQDEEAGIFYDTPNVTLYSYAGSTTKQYAEQFNIPFVLWTGWRQGADGQLRYYDKNGNMLTNQFFFDGKFTYYLQADGTMMKDRLTYHPDGEHIIYFDKDGHEVFNAFQYCPSVGYTCYFDSQGYLYKDKITFVGDKAYYLNGNGKMEDSGWFQFANGVDYGYADPDGSLRTNGFSYDPWGRVVFYHWNGMVARGLITDEVWYYLMDYTDGHYLGSFPVA